ncbi:MAG: pimeloyl-ACP methyl ester carboxylesterase [Salibacteraceae bacterium]|jgi:pimeloyl-ACP methyl ester carboxylesterase
MSSIIAPTSSDIMPTSNDLLYFETHDHSVNNEWILLVHGAGGSTRTWKRQVEELGAHYNLLIIDLPGHGKNSDYSNQHPIYSFHFMAEKIWEVIDHLKISKLHIIGVSLGTVICLQMRILQPDRILSVIMPGAIVKLNTKLKILANFSLGLAKIIGYHNFYNLSAHIMMPRSNHKKSRDTFIKESKVITINEFRKWTALYYNLNKTLVDFFNTNSNIPQLLIMGSQDHLFLTPARDYSIQHPNTELSVVPDCGHVVSIERAQQFNMICLQFLKSLS